MAAVREAPHGALITLWLPGICIWKKKWGKKKWQLLTEIQRGTYKRKVDREMDYTHWPFYLVHLAGVRYPMKWLVTLPKLWYDRRWCSDALVVTSGCLDYCLWPPTCLILPTADILKAFSSTRNHFSLRKPCSVNPRGGCATEENPSWSAVC